MESPSGHQVFSFGVYEFLPRDAELRKRGVRVKLQEQPLKILDRLLKTPGHLVTREELRQILWKEDTFVDFDHGLNEAVKKLRLALGDTAQHPAFIETVPRHGYRFLAPVTSRGGTTTGSHPAFRQRSRLAAWSAAAGLLALAAATSFLVVGTRGSFDNLGAGRWMPVNSIAVLPLVNLSGDPEDEYFADGMTEELIAELAKLGSVRVTSRTSIMRFKGTSKPLADIARELDVDALLEGSVRLAGGRLRVTAQLVHGSTDRHLWGESFDVELHDVLDLQREMAAAIVGRVRVELAPTASPAAAERVDPESYQDYLRGRYYWNQRTPEGFQKAIEHFRRAAERDPSYAPAYAGLADCYNLQGVYNLLPPGEAFPRAKAAAQRALALDPELAEAYNSLAWAQFVYDWDWASAERGFEKALALKPGYATAHQQRAVLLAALGRMQEAVQEIDRARELDPLSLSINEVAGWVRYCARQSNAAIDQYRRTLGLDPNFGPARRYLGLVYLEMGEIEQAFAEFEQARAALGDGPELSADLARAYAMAGQEDQARERLEELTATVGRQYVSPFLLASVHAGLGDKDGAFDWLEKAFAARAVNLVFINVDPLFDGLRGDPRFRDLIERIGLPSFPAS